MFNIKKEVNDLIKKYNTTSIIKYDLVFNKISDVINDINTVNLFSDKKVIICSSINNIDNIDILVKYLDNQNDNILILTNEDKIDLKILNKIKWLYYIATLLTQIRVKERPLNDRIIHYVLFIRDRHFFSNFCFSY